MLKNEKLRAFLGLSFILLCVGYIAAPFSIELWIDSLGNWEWEEFFTDDSYIYQADSFRDIHYSDEGLRGLGDCNKDPNLSSGVYAYISYSFASETTIKKTVLDISAYSESQQCAVKIFVDENLTEFFLEEKSIDITEYTRGKTSFSLKLEFWIINCTYEKDLRIQHLKLIGESEIPEPEPEWTQPPDEETDPEPQKIYYRLSEYIRNDENPSLQRHVLRCIHGWLYLLKSATGVVI